MATIEIGGLTIQMPRRSQRKMEIWVKLSDDAFGPHFGLQREGEIMYVSPTYEEALALRELCDAITKA